MGYYQLNRKEPEGTAVNGELYEINRQDGKPAERTKLADTLENADVIIPAGLYWVRITYSPRFKKFMPIIENVPGRTGIRIHYGTKPEHSKGCVLITNWEKYRAFFRNLDSRNGPTFIEIIHPKFEI